MRLWGCSWDVARPALQSVRMQASVSASYCFSLLQGPSGSCPLERALHFRWKHLGGTSPPSLGTLNLQKTHKQNMGSVVKCLHLN